MENKMNRFGRRNIGSSVSSGVMSRRQFAQGLGLAAGAVAATGLGFAKSVNAQTPPGSGTNDPYGLLNGASTYVDVKWNPSIPPERDGKSRVKSAVTVIKFHTNVPDNTGTTGAVYIPSYQPGGLVDSPVGMLKVMNGISYTEYSGELSGYGYSSGIVSYGDGGQYVYGNYVPSLNLKGVSFVLRIPQNWNGSLIHFMHGGIANLAGLFFTSPFDEFYLLSQGFAYITMNCTGYSQATDTNQNNDEYWRDALYGDWQFQDINPAYATSNVSLFHADGTKEDWALVPEPMFCRDAIRVMKNICTYHGSHQYPSQKLARTYLWARSWSGDLSMGIMTGRSWNGAYLGGNYVTPFSNCPKFPDGSKNPKFSRNAPMVYDGMISFQAGNSPLFMPDFSYTMDLDPGMPISAAPFVMYNAACWSWDDLVLPWLAHKAKNHNKGEFSSYWPDIKKTIFYYMFENIPHFGRESVYAIDKNGSGLYAAFDPDSGIMSFNTDGIGQEVRWSIKRLYDIDPSVLIYSIMTFASIPGLFLYFGNTSPTQNGLGHQLLNNLHSYVTNGSGMSKSVIDPYSINGGIMWPKFVDGGIYGRSDITDWAPQTDISSVDVFGGAYYDAIRYILTYDVLDFDRALTNPLRMPDDAARVGLYNAIFAGTLQPMYQSFTQAELIRGWPGAGSPRPLDWNGQPLVTMTLDGRQIPQDGYRDQATYLRAVTQVVNTLVQKRLYDPHMGDLFIAKAAQTSFPYIQGQNLGGFIKKFEENPLSEKLKREKRR